MFVFPGIHLHPPTLIGEEFQGFKDNQISTTRFVYDLAQIGVLALYAQTNKKLSEESISIWIMFVWANTPPGRVYPLEVIPHSLFKRPPFSSMRITNPNKPKN